MPLKFYYPAKGTLPVSVTGTYCALRCKHCNTVALRHMVDASKPDHLWEIARRAKNDGMNSLLVSGGSNLKGEVPLWRHVGVLKKIREELRLRINAHIGLMPRKKISDLGDAVDVVSLDIPASNRVVKEIYGLGRSVQDYLDLLKEISMHYRTVPHLTTLLYYGRSSGEYWVIDQLANIGVKKLIINVFMPLPGTPMEYVVPNIEEAVDIMRYAAEYDWELVLGCMRPRVRRLEFAAVELGFHGIVLPSRAIERMAGSIAKNYCCALD